MIGRFAIVGCLRLSATVPGGAWGIDAAYALSADDGPPDTGYESQFRSAGIGIVRERTPNPGMAKLRAAGFRVVSFIDLGSLPIEQRGDALPEDLLGAFAAAKAMQAKHAAEVDAWEMVGEADIGYCRDLPDRLAAFQKAVYLGIKADAARKNLSDRPLVLMGALAQAPGPWLERAARNGLLAYTDAYNFHYYGYAEDLDGEIRAHRAVAEHWLPKGRNGDRGALPLWITECGLNAVLPDDFLNADRRKMQADFAVATAAQARAAEGVAVFMPFVLAHEGDPHAMTLGPDRPLAAWTAYSAYAREHPFPTRIMAHPPTAPNPIVLQWVPDLRTAIPSKISGSYRFWEQEPMEGTMRIYNFGDAPRTGVLSASRVSHVDVQSPRFLPSARTAATEGRDAPYRSHAIAVPPHGREDVPMTLTPNSDRYFRDEWEMSFDDDAGGHSVAGFGLEATPREDDFTAAPLALTAIAPDKAMDATEPGASVTSQSGPWKGIDGLQVDDKGDSLVVSGPKVVSDPLRPMVARAAIVGLPPQGVLRVQLDRPMDSNFQVRVDLLDKRGQRFAIWENFGASYFGPGDDLWLNLADFNVYSWGRCTEHPVLRPGDVTEIQLRCYCRRANDPRTLRLSFLRPRAESDDAR